MRFITVLFLLVSSFAYSQWTPYNVNMEVKGKFQADKGIYFKQGADSGKVWMCIDDSAGLGEWRTISGGSSTIDTSNFWNINGNSGTDSTNFLGTTDAKDLVLKANGTEYLRLVSGGEFEQQLRGQATVYQNGYSYVIGDTTSGLYVVVQPSDTSILIEADGSTFYISPAGARLSAYHSNSDYTFGINAMNYNEIGEIDDVRVFARKGEDIDSGIYMRASLTDGIGFYSAGEFKDGFDTTGAITIKDGTQANGYVLTSDANGLGSWQAESMTLISTVTASNSATVDFTGLGSGSYVIYYTDVIPSTNSTTLNFRYGTGGTPTYQTSSYVYSISFNLNTGTSITTSNSTSASSFVLHGATTGTGEGVSGVLTMLNPSGTSIYHPMTFAANDFNGGNNYFFNGGGCWKSTTAVTAGRFLFSSGNIASGTFKIYKIK